MADLSPDPGSDPAQGQPEVTIDDVMRSGSLCSHLMLDRERGVLALKKVIKTWENPADEQAREQGVQDRERLEGHILQVLEETQIPENDTLKLWEMKHGCLLACCPLLSSAAGTYPGNKDFLWKLQNITLTLMTDSELLVQLTAGSVLASLGKHLGPSVYLSSRDLLFDLITTNLSLTSSISPEDELKSVEQGFDIHISSHLIRDKILVETNGYLKVEPSIKCLLSLIENLEKEFVNCVDSRLIDLVKSCFVHPNRNVREAGFEICTAIIRAAPVDFKEFACSLVQHLSRGMSDNWSHVRYAASITTRTFFLAFSNNKEEFFPVLLPKLTLSRYYKSDGSRFYAQESWRLIVGTSGCSFVAKYITDVVNCYLESISSGNIAEREATCSSILELAAKIERDNVIPFVVPLLQALIKCCQDESWSVRDSASLAVGGFIQHYPEQSKAYLPELYPALFKNLEDPVQLLRQGAASALASIAKAYGADSLSLILDKVVPGLSATERMNESSSSDGNPAGTEDTGAIRDTCAQHSPHFESAIPRKIEVTSASLFQAMNLDSDASPACSNISPSTSCAICQNAKIPQPWHISDGCMFLIGTLAEQQASLSELPPLIPLMVKSTQIRSYEEHYQLHVTLCQVVPFLAKAIGKRPFKEFLDMLFEPIFYTAQAVNPQISATGRDCLRFLGQYLGPNILKARVELYDTRLLHVVEDIIY